MNEPNPHNGMSEIVQTVARLVRGFILLYGIHLIVYGHVASGGGFAGGVVIACAFTLMTIAGGSEQGLRFFSWRAASTLYSCGVLLFLFVAAMGAWWAGEAFFTNFIGTAAERHFTLFSGGVIPLANLGVGINVVSSLFLVLMVLAALRITASDSDEREDES